MMDKLGGGSFRLKVRNLQFVLLVDKLGRFNRKYDQSHVTSSKGFAVQYTIYT